MSRLVSTELQVILSKSVVHGVRLLLLLLLHVLLLLLGLRGRVMLRGWVLLRVGTHIHVVVALLLLAWSCWGWIVVGELLLLAGGDLVVGRH